MTQIDNRFELNEEVIVIDGNELKKGVVTSISMGISASGFKQIEYRIKRGEEHNYRLEHQIYKNVDEALAAIKERFEKYGDRN